VTDCKTTTSLKSLQESVEFKIVDETLSKMKKETSETQGSFSVVGNTVKLVAIPAVLAFLVQYLLTYFLSFTFGVSEPWQKIWDGVVDKLGEDPFTYHVYATAVVTPV
jgi:hypothetical protein